MNIKQSIIFLTVPVAIIIGIFFLMNMNFILFVAAMITEVSLGIFLASRQNGVVEKTH